MTSTAQADLQSALLARDSLICLDTNCLLYFFKGEMPWADSLRPVFEAKDQGNVSLFTSSMTLAELLARVDPSDQSSMLSSIRQYFNLVPVNDDIGIQAANIRRAPNPGKGPRPLVKTPDAVEMATAENTRSLLFITNDEQLTRMPQTVKALYLKELALDWLEDEFNACISSNTATAIPDSPPPRLDLTFRRDPEQDWMVLQNAMSADLFVSNALLIAELVNGPCAVIAQVQRQNGEDQAVALRVLPTGRPWITPAVPDWIRHITNTNKKFEWIETGPRDYVRRVKQFIESGAQRENRQNEAFPFIVVNHSRLDAETEVNALDGNSQMAEHKKRQEILRRYLAPFKPVIPLLEIDGARLWKAEVQNAHELDIERFRKFFACAENVIGKEGG